MPSIKFAYVILHYNTIEDTVACVESIRDKAKGMPYKIVIVDNCSPNGSGKEIKRKYIGAEDVHVILNEKNEGFAKGNNHGFLYAKQQLGAKFIVLMNNDTLMLSNDFQQKVETEYDASKCALIGPMIHTPDKSFNVNPMPDKYPSLLRELYQQFKQYIYWGLSRWDIDLWIHDTFGKEGKLRGKHNTSKKSSNKREENVMLHGCCWIFTPEYISRFDGLNDQTFLYNEENILYLRCMKNGLKTVYLPSIEIYHKEDSATDSLKFKAERNKRQFIYKYTTQSKWVLIGEILK